jgi:hypothetical protein
MKKLIPAESIANVRPFKSLWAFFLVALTAVAGCPRTTTTVESVKPAASTGLATIGSAGISASPKTDASNGQEAEPAPTREKPLRTSAAGSTRGTIACGSARCTPPTEVCTWDEPSFDWVCRAASQVTPDFEVIRYACDDGFDCPDGETCCNPFDRGTFGTTACVRRAEVSSRCFAEICGHGGAKCPPGSTCTAKSPTDEGFCEFEKGPATCEGKKQCPKDKPICILNKDKKLECTTLRSDAFNAVPSTQRWQCTRAQDCHGGESCSYAFGEIEHDFDTYCANYSPAYGGSELCDPTGPSPCGKDAECLKAYECTPDPNRPKWMGVWGRK